MWFMRFDMIGLGKKFKIFGAIVELISIDVVDNFVTLEKSTKFFTQYNSMFKGVAVSICRWMAWGKNAAISFYNHYTTLPIVMFFTSNKLASAKIRTEEIFRFRVPYSTWESLESIIAKGTIYINSIMFHIQYSINKKGACQ